MANWLQILDEEFYKIVDGSYLNSSSVKQKKKNDYFNLQVFNFPSLKICAVLSYRHFFFLFTHSSLEYWTEIDKKKMFFFFKLITLCVIDSWFWQMFIQSCLSLCECNVQILILCNDHKLFPYIQIEAAEWQINFFFFFCITLVLFFKSVFFFFLL